MEDQIHRARKDYQKGEIDPGQLPQNPHDLLQAWLDAAAEVDAEDFNAMSVATIAGDGSVNNRIVLLRECANGILRFYTNYASQKGQDLAANAQINCLFFWPLLERQVRIKGIASKTSAHISDAYFASRPRSSQLGAWASNQSKAGELRALEARIEHYTEAFEGQPIPRPEGWGGFDVVPFEMEFWQGRPSRLHQRFRYRASSGKDWVIERLDP